MKLLQSGEVVLWLTLQLLTALLKMGKESLLRMDIYLFRVLGGFTNSPHFSDIEGDRELKRRRGENGMPEDTAY